MKSHVISDVSSRQWQANSKKYYGRSPILLGTLRYNFDSGRFVLFVCLQLYCVVLQIFIVCLCVCVQKWKLIIYLQFVCQYSVYLLNHILFYCFVFECHKHFFSVVWNITFAFNARAVRKKSVSTAALSSQAYDCFLFNLYQNYD
jgi:hypothetical protein